VSNDTNGFTQDVFVFDRAAGTVSLVSHNVSGGSGNSSSSAPVISGDGNFIAFTSNASDLVSNDTNSTQDVFVFDRAAGVVSLVSRNTSGGSGNSSSGSPVISGDGNFIAFTSNATNLVSNDTNNNQDVFVYDRTANATALVSHNPGGGSGNSYSYSPVISGDGNFVAFTSYASDLVNNDLNGSAADVFLANVPTIPGVGPVTPSQRTTPPSSVNVVFSRAIDPTSFDVADLTLTRNGVAVPLTGVTVSAVGSGNTTFTIAGLAPITTADGTYVLTVNGAGILNAFGTAGFGSSSTTWVLDTTGPTVKQVVPISPDPRNTPVDRVYVILSETIDPTTFTTADLTLTLNGNPVSLDAGVTIRLLAGAAFEIGGLAPSTVAGGTYVLTVSTAGVSDPLGNWGTGSMSDSWLTDLVSPQVTALETVSPNPRGPGPGSLDVTFSEPINLATFTSADVTLTCNGGPNLITGAVTVSSVSGSTYRLNGLSGLTTTDGAYTLTVNAAGIQDLAGNAGLGTASETWTVDATPPAVIAVAAVTPSPRAVPVDSLDVQMSEPINLSTFNASDLTLTLDGGSNLITGAVTVTLQDAVANIYRINGLTDLTGADGHYTLTVNAAGIQDLVGNFGTGSGSVTWVMNAASPTVVSVGPVTPDPRNSAVSSIDVVMSEAIDLGTFNPGDLSLTLDGGPNLITGAVTVTQVSGSTYRLDGLAPLTGAAGTYVLTVDAHGLTDLLGNSGTNVLSDSWVVDLTSPHILSVGPVIPSQRTTPVLSVDVTFDKPIDPATFDYHDVTLTRDGGANLAGSDLTVTFVSGTTYRIGNLRLSNSTDGDYVLNVVAAGITDPAGNAGIGTQTASWHLDTTGPTLVSVGPVTPDPRTTPVDFIDVQMSEPINLSTFTYPDVTLTRDGGPNLITSAVTISSVGGNTYRISGLSSLTTADGTYLLMIDAAGIRDVLGNSGTNIGLDTWVMNAASPTVVSVGPVTPDPRNSAVSSIDVVMSEAIDLGTFNAGDLSLTLNGGPNLITAAVTITQVSGSTYRINGLAGLTGAAGTYLLTVDASGIRDLQNTFGTGSASDSWTVDLTAPTVLSLGPVTPNPRSTAVTSVQVVLSEAIDPATFDFTDLTLTLDGGPNLITSAATISDLGAGTYRIGLPGGLTAAEGTYSLTVTGSGIRDAAGNAATGSATVSWTVDTTGPSVVSFVPVVPDPRATPVASVDVVLSEAVNLASFTFADLTLTRDGGPNLITGAVTITQVSGSTYRLNGLAGLTAVPGTYVLTVDTGGIRDLLGNLGMDTGSATFTVTEVNQPPIPAPDLLPSVLEDAAAFTIPGNALTANDSPGPNESNQTLTVIAVSNVVGGDATVVSGNVVFTLTPNFNGTASFDYTVQDNGTTAGSPAPLTAVGHATFTVIGVNDPPLAVGDSYVTNENYTLAVQAASGVLANDSDPLGPASQRAERDRDQHGIPRDVVLRDRWLVRVPAGRQLQRPGLLHLSGSR
jgi:hypothetical protein